MIACPSCATELPEASRFCLSCGARLATPAAAEERKVVTTLFCDLVAFTAMSEAADPEDVDAVLRSYHAAARKVIESHGGTVEKFIGDAVVGVFGVPATHEDDPERAVRAGLRIVQALEGMTRPDGSPLQARVGVNTGEALVRLDVDPASGRGFLTGDAVNVAARLEAAAPPGGVAVGALTRELTERVILYEELPAVRAKGKSEPVGAWIARGAVARRGLDIVAELSPLVGREMELTYLSAIFEKTVTQALPQFALIVGEPGIGKSRLVRELFAEVDSRSEMTTWRQGYCPPFGEELTFAALAEIVKGHAGILDSDGEPDVEAKLEGVLQPGPERQWFKHRLSGLVGLDVPEASREENFTAWTRFLESLAADQPTVLVIEDLHWADPALLVFVEHLVLHTASVPLLVVGTARPELFERETAFAAACPVSRINVGPLSQAETAGLITAVLGEYSGEADATALLAARCEGNPFFAEQSARLLADAGGELLPDSVQAVIAARLDALSPQHKRLLADAAVVGSVFWDGPIAAMTGLAEKDVDAGLAVLVERHLVRRIRESSIEGLTEYAFVHALARDVAYQQLTRGSRARGHAAFANWLEAQASSGSTEPSELLVHHYSTALGLAEAIGDQVLEAKLREPLILSLERAGVRATALYTESAERHLSRALDLLDAKDSRRGRVLAKWALAVADSGRYDEALPAFAEAASLLQQSGEITLAAEAEYLLGGSEYDMGMPGGISRIRHAVEMIHGQPASLEKMAVLSNGAALEADLGSPALALDLASAAVAAGDELDLSIHGGDPQGCSYCQIALMARGYARCHVGDLGGLDDMRVAAKASKSQGLYPLPIMNYEVALLALRGPVACLPAHLDAVEAFSGRGIERLEVRLLCNGLTIDCVAGRWDKALRESGAAIDRLSGAHDVGALVFLKASLALLHVSRGDIEAARPFVDWALERAREAAEPEYSVAALIASSSLVVKSDPALAHTYLGELLETLSPGLSFGCMDMLPHALRTARLLRAEPCLEDLASRIELRAPMHDCARILAQALLSETRGDNAGASACYADAADRDRALGLPYEEAQALLGQGRCLVALGRAPEAAAPLAAAREIFARLGAKPALEETDALLEKAGR